MKFELAGATKPQVKRGDFLVSNAGIRFMIMFDETEGKLRVVDMENNIILPRKYITIDDVLQNFSIGYTIYNGDSITLKTEEAGVQWQ